MRRFGRVALALVFLMLAGTTSALAEKRIGWKPGQTLVLLLAKGAPFPSGRGLKGRRAENPIERVVQFHRVTARRNATTAGMSPLGMTRPAWPPFRRALSFPWAHP